MQFIYFPTYSTIHLFVYLSIFLPVDLAAFAFSYLPVSTVGLPISIRIRRPSVNVAIYLPVYQFLYPCLFIYPPIYLFSCLPITLSIYYLHWPPYYSPACLSLSSIDRSTRYICLPPCFSTCLSVNPFTCTSNNLLAICVCVSVQVYYAWQTCFFFCLKKRQDKT